MQSKLANIDQKSNPCPKNKCNGIHRAEARHTKTRKQTISIVWKNKRNHNKNKIKNKWASTQKDKQTHRHTASEQYRIEVGKHRSKEQSVPNENTPDPGSMQWK